MHKSGKAGCKGRNVLKGFIVQESDVGVKPIHVTMTWGEEM
jgi:hypothetical protein